MGILIQYFYTIRVVRSWTKVQGVSGSSGSLKVSTKSCNLTITHLPIFTLVSTQLRWVCPVFLYYTGSEIMAQVQGVSGSSKFFRSLKVSTKQGNHTIPHPPIPTSRLLGEAHQILLTLQTARYNTRGFHGSQKFLWKFASTSQILKSHHEISAISMHRIKRYVQLFEKIPNLNGVFQIVSGSPIELLFQSYM